MKKKIAMTVKEGMMIYETIENMARGLQKMPMQTSMDLYDNVLTLRRVMEPSDAKKQEVMTKHGIPPTTRILTPEQMAMMASEFNEINALKVECELFVFTAAEFGPAFLGDINLTQRLWPILYRPELPAAAVEKPKAKPGAKPAKE